jgi:hypothetical protein
MLSMAEFSRMESVSFDERHELDLLRDRVRATRRATSGPLLAFGVAISVFAIYDGTVNYAFVPSSRSRSCCSGPRQC